MKTVLYYINDKFVLDGGIPGGVNLMLWGGDHDPSYWFFDKRFNNVNEAQAFLEEYTLNGDPCKLVEKQVEHPIANRIYTPEEWKDFAQN